MEDRKVTSPVARPCSEEELKEETRKLDLEPRLFRLEFLGGRDPDDEPEDGHHYEATFPLFS